MFLLPWTGRRHHSCHAILRRCLHCSSEVVVSDAAMHGRWGVQGSPRSHRMELQHRQQSQDHKGDPIVPLISRGVVGNGGGRTYTAQRTYKIVRKCTLMDVYEEPVIVSFFWGCSRDGGWSGRTPTLLAILNKTECPWSFTAKDSITHNPLLLLQKKVNYKLNGTWLDDKKKTSLQQTIFFISLLWLSCVPYTYWKLQELDSRHLFCITKLTKKREWIQNACLV